LLGITALGVAALACSGERAAAQPPVEEIAIVAPHQITHKKVGYGSLGMPIEEVTITHKVGFKDLDLKSEAGAAALEKRIKDVAKHACWELDELYPKSRAENRRCESNARESAQAQMEAAVAAARK
jgi:UrcA family protein